jgi:membrane protein insertase Oxa1/YidC/SpoIIIJ
MLDLFGHLYTIILYQPVYNLVIALYNFSPGPNLGWAIVMLSIIVRLLFLPLTLKGYKTDKLLEDTAGQIRAVENEGSLDSREKRSKITEILRSKGINPVSEIVSLLGQMLFLLILFQIVQNGITPSGYDKLYSFVSPPHGDLDTTFIGNIVVSHPNFLYSIVAAGLLFIEQIWEYEAKKNIPEATFSERWYPLLLAAFTFIILIILPATKALFFIVSILFSMGIRLMFTLGRLGKKAENVR